MKTSTKLILGFFTIVFIGISVILSIAKYHAFKPAVEPAGKIISKSETLNSYSKLVLHENYKVHLSQGKGHKYLIKGDENYINNLRVELREGVLEISRKEKAKMEEIEITLYFENLESVIMSGGTSLDCLSELHGKTIIINASGGASGLLLLNYSDIQCDNSSGSSLKLKGITDEFKLQASSGSNVDANELASKNSTVEGSSGAIIKVNVKDQLNANLSSGAVLTYAGNPTIKNVHASSGGSAEAE